MTSTTHETQVGVGIVVNYDNYAVDSARQASWTASVTFPLPTTVPNGQRDVNGPAWVSFKWITSGNGPGLLNDYGMQLIVGGGATIQLNGRHVS